LPKRLPSSANGVFINCPFDTQYREFFEALVFTIFACGFLPRSAKELDDGGELRLNKLYTLIKQCRYGIHDVSRTEPDETSGLPRFNMPLELGIFLGAKKFGDKAQKEKRAMILDVEQYRYQKFISDLAGADIHAHHNNVLTAVRETRDWLANVSRRDLPSAQQIQRLLQGFSAQLPDIAQRLEFDPKRIPYIDFEKIVVAWLANAQPPKSHDATD
jgi:hypothetical protein